MRPSAEAVQLDKLRKMSASERLALADELRRINLDLVAAGIRERRGELPPEDLRLEVLRLILPERLFRAAYLPH